MLRRHHLVYLRIEFKLNELFAQLSKKKTAKNSFQGLSLSLHRRLSFYIEFLLLKKKIFEKKINNNSMKLKVTIND